MTDAASGVARLDRRAILAVTGEDRVGFLQGLVSNNVEQVAADRALYACLLTPQGKFLHDFMMVAQGDRLLLEVEVERFADLLKKLKIHKLRSKVGLEDLRAAQISLAAFGPGVPEAVGLPAEPGRAVEFAGGIAFVDPRLADLGVRAIVPADQVEAAVAALGLPVVDVAAYDRHRIALGVPDGSADMVLEKAILLENNIDELNGVSWDKGCYMGQELTARTKYRGLIKKRLMTVALDGPAPVPGTPILADGREVGEMRTSAGDAGLAVIRLDAARKVAAGELVLEVDGTRVTPAVPAYGGFSLEADGAETAAG